MYVGADMTYDNTNRGALFRNKDKDASHPNWSDYQGTINVNGVEYYIDAWLKTAKQSGQKFMSLGIRPKEEYARKNTQARAEYMAAEADDSDLPF
jgi:hypothetical protein